MFEPQDGVVPKDDALIRTIDLSKDYMLGTDIVKALTDINFQVYPGQFVAIVGRSGSGKTTLLNIMAGLDKPTSGSVVLRGKDIGKMGEKDLTQVRRHTIGFIFQSFGLLPLLSAFENVELP